VKRKKLAHRDYLNRETSTPLHKQKRGRRERKPLAKKKIDQKLWDMKDEEKQKEGKGGRVTRREQLFDPKMMRKTHAGRAGLFADRNAAGPESKTHKYKKHSYAA